MVNVAAKFWTFRLVPSIVLDKNMLDIFQFDVMVRTVDAVRRQGPPISDTAIRGELFEITVRGGR